MNRLTYSALGLGVALICAMPATAQEDLSVHVSYADLNLFSATGAATFARRIDAAVATVCGPGGDLDLSRALVVKRCHAEVGADAHARMDKVLLAAQQAQAVASAKMVTLAVR